MNFILRHCTVDQSCKYFTSTKEKTDDMFCSFTTNKKSSSLLFSCALFGVCTFFFVKLVNKHIHPGVSQNHALQYIPHMTVLHISYK